MTDDEEEPPGRPPFHPLRFIDFLRENWPLDFVLFLSLFPGLSIASNAPEPIARLGFLILMMEFLVAITPRATIYGHPVGVWPSGELYDRLFGNERTES